MSSFKGTDMTSRHISALKDDTRKFIKHNLWHVNTSVPREFSRSRRRGLSRKNCIGRKLYWAVQFSQPKLSARYIFGCEKCTGVTGLRVPRITRPAGHCILEFCVRRTSSPRCHCPPGQRPRIVCPPLGVTVLPDSIS